MALTVAVKENLKQYQHRNAAEKDCVNALTAFKSLAAESELYRYPNGPSIQLVHLKGTIPVQYKGNKYNIPICIWLQEKYPYVPPIVFVMPTETMVIKQGKHVDTSGRVYLTFLHEWKYPASDLYGLLQVLCFTFAEEPPVYTRIAASPRPSHVPYLGYSGSSGAAPHHSHQRTYVQLATSSIPGGIPGYATPSGTETYAGSSSNAFSRTKQRTSSEQQDSLLDDAIKESLRYAIEEELSRRLKEVFELDKSEIDGISPTKEQLQNASRALNDIQGNISDEATTIENNNQIMEQKNQELRDMIAKMENNAENLNVDEAVVNTAPLYNQLKELFTEEKAVADAFDSLGETRRREVSEFDALLKALRKLSRKMLMLRTQLQKARETAGLR